MMRKLVVVLALAFLSALGFSGAVRAQVTDEISAAITEYAALYNVPEALVHKIVKRESKYNPSAYHRGNWGLMQIKYATARSMGYRGPAKGLLDAHTNLQYGVKYLAGAYLVADGNEKKAMRYYVSGYYYAAKRKGLLEETGLKTTKR